MSRDIILNQKKSSITLRQTGRRGLPGEPGADGLLQSIEAGANVTVDATDPANPIISVELPEDAVISVNGKTGEVVLDTSDVDDTTNKRYVTEAEKTKLSNLSGVNTGDQDLSGLVPNTRTVNGHALSSDVTVSKSDVGLGNVDNTSDNGKPVSSAQASAIAVVQSDIDTHEADTNNPHNVTKTQVGLANADNTSDANKPVSAATQTALNGKLDTNTIRTGLESAIGDPTQYSGKLFYATDTAILYISDGTTWNIRSNLSEGIEAPLNFERKQETYIIAPADPVSGLTKSASLTATDDSTDFILGTKSMKFVTNGGGGALTATKAISPTVDLSDKVLVLAIKIDDFSKLNDLQVRVSSDNFGSGNYEYFKPVYTSASQRWVEGNKWAIITINRGQSAGASGGAGQWQTAGTGIGDWTAINAITFRLVDTGSACTIRINSLGYFTRQKRAKISLCFDDIRASHYTVAKPKLDQYKMRASSFVMDDVIGLSSYMTMAQIKSLQEDSRWEISTHAHTDNTGVQAHTKGYDGLTAYDGERDVLQSKHYLRLNAFKGIDIMALPHGTWSANTVGTPNANPDVLGMMAKYFNVVRSTYSTTWETYPPANQLKLRALTVGGLGGDTAASLLALVDMAITHKHWLILNFHNLVSSLAISSDFLISEFNTFIDGLAARNIDVMPLGEVLAGRDLKADDSGVVHTTGAETVAGVKTFSSAPVVPSGSFPESSIVNLTTDLAVKAPSSRQISTGNGLTGGGDLSADRTLSASYSANVPSDPSSQAASAGVANTLARSDHSHPVYVVQPSDHGFLGWNFDPATNVSGTTAMPAAGTALVLRLFIPKAITISNLYVYVGSQGSVLTNTYMALYQGGSLLAQTADMSTAFQSSGLKTGAITPHAVTVGTIDIVLWVGSASSLPQLARGISLGVANANLSAANARFATADTGLAATAPSTLGAKTILNNAFWAAIS